MALGPTVVEVAELGQAPPRRLARLDLPTMVGRRRAQAQAAQAQVAQAVQVAQVAPDPADGQTKAVQVAASAREDLAPKVAILLAHRPLHLGDPVPDVPTTLPPVAHLAKVEATLSVADSAARHLNLPRVAALGLLEKEAPTRLTVRVALERAVLRAPDLKEDHHGAHPKEALALEVLVALAALAALVALAALAALALGLVVAGQAHQAQVAQDHAPASEV